MATVALRTSRIGEALRLAVLAGAYFSAAKISLVFAIPPGYATAVWLPSGLAVAAVMRWGASAWPGIWAGAALANFSIGGSVPAAIGIATGNTVEALLVGCLVPARREWADGLREPARIFTFAAVAAVASAVAAALGTSTLFLSGAIGVGDLLGHAYTWWQGDSTGILLLAPCAMAWALPAPPAAHRLYRLELAVFAMLFGALLLALFARVPRDDATRAAAFLVFPFLAWAACRFSPRAASTGVLAAATLAVLCTINGRGPFASGSVNESMLTLQAFTSTAALIVLVLGAFTRQRERALRRVIVSHGALDDALRFQDSVLRTREHEFERAQSLAHMGLWSWDSRSGRMAWSRELARICGRPAGAPEGGLETYVERVDERDRARVRTLLRGAFFDGQPFETMQRVVRPDGERRTLHCFCHVVPRSRNEPNQLLGFCLDVTERDRLERGQALLNEIALTLARGPSTGDAVRATLRAACHHLDFALACYWRLDATRGALTADEVHPSGAPECGREVSERAWRECRPIADDRARAVEFALPVATAGAMLGAIALSGGRGAGAGPSVEVAASVGALLGEFLRRARVERALRDA